MPLFSGIFRFNQNLENYQLRKLLFIKAFIFKKSSHSEKYISYQTFTCNDPLDSLTSQQ